MAELSCQTSNVPDTRRVTRLVIISQVLFTAGHSLTTGGFLSYFIYEFEPSAMFMAAIQIAPETSEAMSFVTRYLLAVVPSRKWVWVATLLVARISALMIPFTAIFFPESLHAQALLVIMAAIIGWHIAQGVAYCCYISWLSDLVPEFNWGKFFAKRRIASLGVSIVVPTIAGLYRSRRLSSLSPDWQIGSYVIIFVTGGLLVVMSILPMLWLPDRPVQHTQAKHPSRPWRENMDSSFRWLIASRWWLAFFQGLTQAVILKFSISVLKISLEEYYVLAAVMLSLQILTAAWAGRMCDRSQDKAVTFGGMVIVSFAMAFWVLASPASKWFAIGAYVLWGGFGFVNVGLHNLTLKLAPESDNTFEISLSRQMSGLIAGGAGLLGGWCLESLLNSASVSDANAYRMLFAISWAGRLLAPFFLLPVQQPELRD